MTGKFASYSWCGKCLQDGMKSIAFRAIKDGNGYVRSSFVGNTESEARPHVAWEIVIVGGMLVLSAAIVWLFLFAK